MYRIRTILIVLVVTCGFARDAISKDAESAKTLARRAVVAGMMGDQDRRTKLLASAISEDADNTTANWALGRVSVNDKWIALQDYEQQMQGNKLLVEYERRRSELKSGTLTEMQLANWCREQRLFGREKLHLTSVWRSESATPDRKRAAECVNEFETTFLKGC